MPNAEEHYPDCPEAMIVSFARVGDRHAFAELVRRRQSLVRNMMRRFCRDATLADDLAQQVFMKVWLNIRKLREADAFGGWLKRLAISVWLQHQRKNDALRGASEVGDLDLAPAPSAGVEMDLDRALATLPQAMRTCIVLSYHEGMTHQEIADAMEIPLGTTKSHITRGTQRLREILSAYRDEPNTKGKKS